MLNIKAFLNGITSNPGVYQMLDASGTILYIGKAKNLKKRLSSYFSSKQKDNKTLALVNHIEDINVIVTHDENEALILECNLIKKNKPHYNVLFRDDKSYPYIVITAEKPYPSIDFYRGMRKKTGHYFGPYPSAKSVRETIYFIQKIFGIRLTSDRYYPDRKRPCLQYQLKLCSGACAGFISKEDYDQDILHAILFLQGKNQKVLDDLQKKMTEASSQLYYEKAAKLRDQIAKFREIQARQYVDAGSSNVDVIGFSLLSGAACIQLLFIRGGRMLGSRAYFPHIPANASIEEIVTSFITQHYLGENKNPDLIPKEIILPIALNEQEWIQDALTKIARQKVILSVHVRQDRKKWLEMATLSAKQALSSHLLNKTNIQQKFTELTRVLALKKSPTTIECFDISHTMGESIVASCVVFNQEGPQKNYYRRFNIKNITPGDDVAAMHQVMLRRYQRLQNEKAQLPSIILVDGGLPQLSAAEKTLNELSIKNILLIGVAKGVTRKPGLETLYIKDKHPIHLESDSIALHLIQQIRDEAHRFAIMGHRLKRDKKRHTSILENIPGVGVKKRRELLRYFGGIQAINRASLEELVKVPGIHFSLAERIFAALHGDSI